MFNPFKTFSNRTMYFYFKLQFRLFNRYLEELSLSPVVGYIVIVGLFGGLSVLLFEKTAYAAYIYGMACSSILLKWSHSKRIDYLKQLFSTRVFRRVRLIENFFIFFPFGLCLLIYGQLYVFLGLLITTLGSAFFTNKRTFQLVIPTPFYKHPFEFMVGFRATWPLIFILYFLTFIAVRVGNYNLGAVALLTMLLLSMSYYNRPENVFYVWVHAQNPKQFLFKKLQTALLSAFVLSLPIAFILIIFFRDKLLFTLAIQLLGLSYLVTMVLGKYVSFPEKISVSKAFLIGFSVWLPLLLVATIPNFYKQAVSSLKTYLK
jgi:hypothetical protein